MGSALCAGVSGEPEVRESRRVCNIGARYWRCDGIVPCTGKPIGRGESVLGEMIPAT